MQPLRAPRIRPKVDVDAVIAFVSVSVELGDAQRTVEVLLLLDKSQVHDDRHPLAKAGDITTAQRRKRHTCDRKLHPPERDRGANKQNERRAGTRYGIASLLDVPAANVVHQVHDSCVVRRSLVRLRR